MIQTYKHVLSTISGLCLFGVGFQCLASPVLSTEDFFFWNMGLQVDDANKPWSLNVIDGNILRFEVRPGDQFSAPRWTDPVGKERNNVQELVQNRHSVDNPISVSFKFLIEPGSPNTAKWVTLGSLKGFYPQSWGGPFEVAMRGERLAITANYESTPGKLVYRDIWVGKTDIIRGKWYDIEIDFKWGPDGSGHLGVSIDEKQILSFDGKLGYYEQTAYLWKTGIYRATAPEALAVQVKHLKLQTGEWSNHSR